MKARRIGTGRWRARVGDEDAGVERLEVHLAIQDAYIISKAMGVEVTVYHDIEYGIEAIVEEEPEPEPDPEPEEPDPEPEDPEPEPEEPDAEPDPDPIPTSPQATVSGDELRITWDPAPEAPEGYLVRAGSNDGSWSIEQAVPEGNELVVAHSGEEGWVCVAVVDGMTISTSRCNSWAAPAFEKHNVVEIIHISDTELEALGEHDVQVVAVRWYEDAMYVPATWVNMESGDPERGWVLVEIVDDGDEKVLRTIYPAWWMLDEDASIDVVSQDPEILEADFELVYELALDPSSGVEVIDRWTPES